MLYGTKYIRYFGKINNHESFPSVRLMAEGPVRQKIYWNPEEYDWHTMRIKEAVEAKAACVRTMLKAKKSIVDFELEKEGSRKIITACPFGFPPNVGSIRCNSYCRHFIGWRVKPLPYSGGKGSIYCRKQMDR